MSWRGGTLAGVLLAAVIVGCTLIPPLRRPVPGGPDVLPDGPADARAVGQVVPVADSVGPARADIVDATGTSLETISY